MFQVASEEQTMSHKSVWTGPQISGEIRKSIYPPRPPTTTVVVDGVSPSILLFNLLCVVLIRMTSSLSYSKHAAMLPPAELEGNCHHFSNC